MAERPSQIPAPSSKRASLSLPLQASTNGGNQQPRSPSPLMASTGSSRKPPPASVAVNGSKRHSLLSAGSASRKSSIETSAGDDPVILKAQITLLQSALQASHARMVELYRSSGIATSASSPGRSSPLPWTPQNGMLELGLDTPGFELNGVKEEEPGSKETKEGEGSNKYTNGHLDGVKEEAAIPEAESEGSVRGLVKSGSIYNLHDRAGETPGKLGLSQIPRAAVAGTLSLHPTPQKNASPSQLSSPFSDASPAPSASNGRISPLLASTGLRKSSNPATAASTRVIDGLQTDLLNTKGHLERVKQEVRSCQRVIGSLTRQTEDLKDTKERMRVECEGLNNVIARKERLLQEVLERARTAESSLSTLQSTRRALEQSTKKAITQMTTQVSEAQAAQMKAESECGSIRDGVKSLKDVWAKDVRGLREEMKRNEDKWGKQKEEAQSKHLALVQLVQSQSEARTAILTLTTTSAERTEELKSTFESQIAGLRAQLTASEEDNKQARDVALGLAEELNHLRRLMREPRRASLEIADVDGTQTSDNQ